MLHRSSQLHGFHVVARDGAIGHVDEFLIDELDWSVRFLVVDTSNWIGGRSVLISAEMVDKVDPVGKRIAVRATRDEIERSPSIEQADVPLAERLPALWIF